MQLTFVRSEPEAGNVKTFHFEKPAGFEYVAGQYQTWKLDPQGQPNDDNAHWFTISSAPNSDTLTITTRVTDSPFKQKLDSLQPGDAITAEKVEGDFTWQSDEAVVLIAGGIGVTPYHSMLVERSHTGKQLNATLVYGNRDDQIVFRDEFEQLKTYHPELKIVYLVGEKLTAERLLQAAPEMRERTTYLSGPEPMVDAIGDDLKAHGVTDLKQDWFPGYTETNY
jgi:ferredoxin-NADP reductase